MWCHSECVDRLVELYNMFLDTAQINQVIENLYFAL